MAVKRNHFDCGGCSTNAGIVTLALTNVKERPNELDLDAFETNDVVEGAPEEREVGGGRFRMMRHQRK